jgi:hypothetical protein
MQNGIFIVAIGVVIGMVLLCATLVMRYKEAKEFEVENSKRDERDARMIEKWAARESRRAK